MTKDTSKVTTRCAGQHICQGLAFTCGFTALLVQTLMFRSFFSTFSGSEWSLAVFFATWLFWYGIGSALAVGKHTHTTPSHIAPLLLLYIPITIIQFLLVLHARNIMGLQNYEPLSLASFLPVLLLINAPIPFYSGTIYHRIASALRIHTPASQTYLIEALGSGVGGILLSLLFATESSTIRILALAFLILTLAVFIIQWTSNHTRKTHLLTIVLAIICLLSLSPRVNQAVSRHLNARNWHSLIPDGTYCAQFTTPAATYLEGTHQNQRSIVAWNTIIETIPDPERAIYVGIMALAQKPDTTTPLIIGAGAHSLCEWFIERPSIKHIHWIAPDADYPSELRKHVPFAPIHANRVLTPRITPLQYLKNTSAMHDLIIINISADQTLADSTFQTTEFLQLAKTCLTSEGILLLRMPGGANHLGSELILSGASILKTICLQFPTTVLSPGEETWVIAANTPLCSDPQQLYDRLTTTSNFRIPYTGKTTMTNRPQNLSQDSGPKYRVSGPLPSFPAEAVWLIYDPSRIDYQTDLYQEAIKQYPQLPLNRTAQPTPLLFAQLATLRQSLPNLPDVTNIVFRLQCHLLPALLSIILTWTILRTCIPRRKKPTGAPKTLLFFVGYCGFALHFSLLFYFQAFVGTLYTTIALASALFMIGLALGGHVSQYTSRRTTHPLLLANLQYIITCLLIAQLSPRSSLIPTQVSGFIPQVSSLPPNLTTFCVLFTLAGATTGYYLPLCEKMLQRSSPTSTTIRQLALCDSLGGATGALTSGIILIPILGINQTLFLLGILLPIFTIPSGREMKNRPSNRKQAIIYLILLPLAGICGLFAFNQKHSTQKTLTDYYAQRSSPTPQPTTTPDLNLNIQPTSISTPWQSATLETPNGLLYPYQTKSDPHHTHIYRIRTHPLTPDIIGYGGPIPMQLTINQDRILLEIEILPNHETPQHLAIAEKEIARLLNTTIDPQQQPTHTDAITGATATYTAMRQTINKACKAFFDLLNPTQHPTIEMNDPLRNIPNTRLPGIPQKANIQQIKIMIRNNQLSDQPAR